MAYDDVITGLAPTFRWQFDGNTNVEGASISTGGGVTGYTTGIIPQDAGQAATFDGTDSISISNNANINAGEGYVWTKRTLSFWFNTSDNDNFRCIWEEGGGVHWMTVYFYQGNLYANSGVGNYSRLVAITPVATGQVYHAVIVFDFTLASDHAKIYLDGQLVAQGTLSGSYSSLPGHSGDVKLAYGKSKVHTNTNNAQTQYNGILQDFCYWTEVALTDAEALSIYEAGAGSSGGFVDGISDLNNTIILNEDIVGSRNLFRELSGEFTLSQDTFGARNRYRGLEGSFEILNEIDAARNRYREFESVVQIESNSIASLIRSRTSENSFEISNDILAGRIRYRTSSNDFLIENDLLANAIRTRMVDESISFASNLIPSRLIIGASTLNNITIDSFIVTTLTTSLDGISNINPIQFSSSIDAFRSRNNSTSTNVELDGNTEANRIRSSQIFSEVGFDSNVTASYIGWIVGQASGSIEFDEDITADPFYEVTCFNSFGFGSEVNATVIYFISKLIKTLELEVMQNTVKLDQLQNTLVLNKTEEAKLKVGINTTALDLTVNKNRLIIDVRPIID